MTPTTPVRDVARLLYTRNISGMPVVDEREQRLLVGIVSEGDLIGHVAAVGEQRRRRSRLAAITEGEALAHDCPKLHGHTAEDGMLREVHATRPRCTSRSDLLPGDGGRALAGSRARRFSSALRPAGASALSAKPQSEKNTRKE